MENLRFSIVIPTRERAETLKFCLQTCVQQEQFDNYEIIVSDNNSSPATKEVVDAFHSDKIKYFSTGSTLAMYENFEFAVSKAQGEYIIVLGDDDGVLLRGLYNLDKIITETKYKVVAWQWIFYYWPEGVPPGTENTVHIPISWHMKVINGREQLKKLTQFEIQYNRLPMLYINAAIHRDYIAELRTKTGRVFDSIIPDVYSAICMGHLCGEFLFMDRPITIAATSGKSTGNNVLQKKSNTSVNEEFSRLNKKSATTGGHTVQNIRSMNAIVSDTFEKAKKNLFAHDLELTIDRQLMVNKILEDITVFDEEEWSDSMHFIRRSLQDDAQLVEWFDGLLSTLHPKITDVAKRQIINTGIKFDHVIINGSLVNLNNVFDVAKLYNQLFESEIYIPDEVKPSFREKEQQNVGIPHTESVLFKIARRLKNATRVLIRG